MLRNTVRRRRSEAVMALRWTMLTLLVACSVLGRGADASAIPMWEYLTKDEKMSYLYSMFSSQVQEYCEFSSMDNCNKELLRYGLKNLHSMPEDHLDAMDPYQRGANSIIWESMMEGHEMMQNKKPSSTTSTTQSSGRHGDDERTNYLAAGSQRFETAVYHQQQFQPPSRKVSSFGFGTRYVPTTQRPRAGPMVVMVHPDGRPVAPPALPEDDDLKQYRMSKAKLPAMADLAQPRFRYY